MNSLLMKTKAEKKIQDLPEKLRNNVLLRKYIRANIPKEFWEISLDNFDGDPFAMRIVEKYCRNLKKARERGIGMMFLGANGVGKTSLIMIILKTAIAHGYRVFHISLPEIFRQIYSGWKEIRVAIELRRLLQETDFLAITELGKSYHRQGSELFMVSEFDAIFRERRGDLRPVFMDTNLNESELKNTFGESLISLFKSTLKIINVKGGDYRKKKQEKDVNSFFKGL